VPRAPRRILPDGFFHVVSRGVARQPIYGDDADRLLFAGLLN
jgi:hypothetical protein